MSLDAWLARLKAANGRGETLVNLNAVAAWMQHLTPTWEAQGYTVRCFPVTHDSPKNSVHMDIDGPTFVSTPIDWDSGEWEVSIGRIEEKHTHTTDYAPASTTEEVLAKVEQASFAAGI